MAKRYRDIVGDGGSDVAGQLDKLQSRLLQRMSSIGHKVAIMSGKGGVGKSTITVNLAAGLASMGFRVGVLDADVYGPCLGQMLGLRRQTLSYEEGGVTPPTTPSGVKLMSMDFFLQGDRTPVAWDGSQGEGYAWKGMLEMHALREFLADTHWGELDVLLCDMPPGTNQFATLHHLLGHLDATVVVTVPSKVSRLVVGRSITMLREVLKVPVSGIIENMTHYHCHNCRSDQPLFAGQDPADYDNVPILGRVAFDFHMVQACDRGVPYVLEHADAGAAQALMQICRDLITQLQNHSQAQNHSSGVTP